MSHPICDIRHEERVRLVSPDEREPRLKVGAEGRVKAISPQGHYLVKFVGRAWPLALTRSQIERY